MPRNRRGNPPPYTTTDPLTNSFANVSITNAASDDVHKIVVGVDFGTTFTGVSWVSTEGTESKTLTDVNCIRNWSGPSQEAGNSWKAPSRIAYGADNGKASNAWGYEVRPGTKAYTWFKLLLDPEEVTKYDDPSLAALAGSEGEGVLSKPTDKTAVAICADFLSEIATFAYKELTKRLSAEVLDATPLEFWFTVPAVWGHKARNDTFMAAHKAAKLAKLKFHPKSSLNLIPEPEAAAIATMSMLTKDGSEQQIKPGDSILICDCGGGTVDITTYEIATVKPKLSFSELLVGTGGKCGSTYIDREFIKWMENKFGDAYKTAPWDKKGPASKLMREFESAKRDFGQSEDAERYYELTMPMEGVEDSEYYDVFERSVRIYTEDLRKLFEPVVSKIIALLQSQLDAEKSQKNHVSIKTIILVGGFGDSAYLNEHVNLWAKNVGVRVLCPQDPQAAIVRGAALSGLQNVQPTSRRARRHYGFLTSQAFDPVRHRLEDKWISQVDRKVWARGNYDWELSKGDTVDQNTCIKMSCTIEVDSSAPGTDSVTVWVCDLDDPPVHNRWPGGKKLASFSISFAGVDLSNMHGTRVNGRMMKDVPIEYQINFGARQGVLTFTCKCKNKNIGSTSIAFDGDDVASPASAGVSTKGGPTAIKQCGVQ